MKKSIITLGMACIFATISQAHQVWLERDGSVARGYFGHWSHDLKEEKGKALDQIKFNRILPEGAAKGVERMQDHVAIQLATNADVTVVEQFPVRKSKLTKRATFYTFVAREGRNDTKGLAIIDLVPSAAGGNDFTVMFDGAPLPRVNVKLYAPNKWSMTFRSDDLGKVSIKTPWKGRYLAEISHTVESKGEFEGKEYDDRGYIYTLSFVSKDGIEWK